MAFTLSPKGPMVVIHQPQPVTHRKSPPFHLFATKVVDGGGALSSSQTSSLGIFQVRPYSDQPQPGESPPDDTGEDAAVAGAPKFFVRLETLHHRLRSVPLREQMMPVQTHEVLFAGRTESDWFPARIKRLNEDGTVWVKYEDGDEEESVQKENLRVRSTLKIVEGKAFDRSIPGKLFYIEDDIAEWEMHDKYTTERADAVNKDDVLIQNGVAVNAVELAARILGHQTSKDLRLYLSRKEDGLSDEVCQNTCLLLNDMYRTLTLLPP